MSRQLKMRRRQTSFESGRAAALVVAVLLTAVSAQAESSLAGRWGIGLEGGVVKLTEGEWDYGTIDHFGSVRLSRGLSPHWIVSAVYSYGYVRPGATVREQEVGWSFASAAPLYTVLRRPAVEILHRFSPVARFSPTLGVSLGMTSWKVLDLGGEEPGTFPSGDVASGYDTDGNATELRGDDLTLGVGLGLDVKMTGSLRFQVGGRYRIMPGNDTDSSGMSRYWGPGHVDANTGSAEGYLGFAWWLGGGDRDRDGVPDDRDGCPDQPEDKDGYNDLDGCPDPDNDGDGIVDALDACPNLAEDPDGYEDDDGCPDPDNDGDGIPDVRDQCPDAAEDVDGYQDRDGCPDPDNDADGVPDDRDRCPHTPADSKVDTLGCVVEVPNGRDLEVYEPAEPTEPEGAYDISRDGLDQGGEFYPESEGDDLILEGVTFRSGSAELTPESRVFLEDIAAWLSADPALPVEVRGHTDSRGDADANRELSRRRAEAVRQALIELGLSRDRLKSTGYGEDQPIASNGTPEGRARNRRVEIRRLR